MSVSTPTREPKQLDPAVFPPSVLVRNQKKTYGPKQIDYYGTPADIIATVRHDDECGNGHNSFSITCDIYKRGRRSNAAFLAGGCCHDEVAKHFPELAPFIKWHLTSTDGPMHYLINTLYLAGERDCWGLLKGEFQALKSKDGLTRWEIPFESYYDPCHKSIVSETQPAPLVLEYRQQGRIGEGKARELDSARSAAVWPDATDEDLAAPGLSDRLMARLPALMREFKAAIESLGFVY